MSAGGPPAPRVAVFAGSFDPVTLGHVDLVRRALGPGQVPEILTTVRQRAEREREIAGHWREGRAAEALAGWMEAREAEFELIPAGIDQGVGTMVWSPLAGGLLSGKYRRDSEPEKGRHVGQWGEPPVYDAPTRSVTMPAAFKKSFDAFMDAEWFRIQLPEALGGQPAPAGVVWSMAELILGAKRDPQFGPMVLVGTGGVMAELFRDVALDLAPVTAERAEAMLRSLRGFPLLDGFRGAEKADVRAVAEAVAAFSALVAAAGERIAEAEINPLIAGPWGCLAVDGLVRCVPA